MSWPLRALLGPLLWALAFSVIYAVHGLGCARGWTQISMPWGSLHQLVLIGLWCLAIMAGLALFRLTPPGPRISDRIARAGSWIGIVSVLLSLFPVLGLTSCEIAPALYIP